MIFDFDEYSRPLWIYLIYITAYLVATIYGMYYISSRKVYRDKSRVRPIVFIAFYIVFAVFYCINSDYFNYRGLVLYTAEGRVFTTQQELIYQELAIFVKGNYELFRAIVWGGAILLTALCCRIMKMPVFMGLFIWFILYYERFCYARASLAMAIFFTGITILISRKNQLLWKVIGVTICLSSIMFHRSMLIACMTIPIVFIKFSKKSLMSYGLFLLFGCLFVISILNNAPYLLTEDYQDKLNVYNSEIATGRWERQSFKNYVSSTIAYSLFYIPLFIFYNRMRKKFFLFEDKVVRLFWISVTITGIATAFWFYYGFNNAYFYRVLFMTAAPNSMLLAYIYSVGMIKSKTIKMILLFSVVYHILYLYTTITTQGIS